MEAWLVRPWQLWVRDLEAEGTGRALRFEGSPPYDTSAWATRPRTPPTAINPVSRPDGLVLERPSPMDVDYDDPMWRDFTWVAMLDPVELAAGVDVDQVQAVTVRGRPTWMAECTPTPAYQARCPGCCDLLDTGVAREAAGGDGGQAGDGADLPIGLPTSYLVGLDVQTGIVVDLAPLGGTSGHGTAFTTRIHAVDQDFTPPPSARGHHDRPS